MINSTDILPTLFDRGIAFDDPEDEAYGEHEYESDPILFVTKDKKIAFGTYTTFCKPDELLAKADKGSFLGYDTYGNEVDVDTKRSTVKWIDLNTILEEGER